MMDGFDSTIGSRVGSPSLNLCINVSLLGEAAEILLPWSTDAVTRPFNQIATAARQHAVASQPGTPAGNSLPAPLVRSASCRKISRKKAVPVTAGAAFNV
ncbi:MAG: hypothetical protein LBQ54_06990 [Planctomycetaceae bacterium]|nr:hypothetical protein [Planctomycetaceae bacterium]